MRKLPPRLIPTEAAAVGQRAASLGLLEPLQMVKCDSEETIAKAVAVCDELGAPTMPPHTHHQMS